MGVDKLGVDKMGVDIMESRGSGMTPYRSYVCLFLTWCETLVILLHSLNQNIYTELCHIFILL